MQYDPLASIFVARLHGDLVILDLADDTYSCIIAADRSLDASDQLDSTLLGPLGLCADTAAHVLAPQSASTRRPRDLTRCPTAQLSCADATRFIASLVETSWHFRRRALRHLLAVARRQERPRSVLPPDELARQVAAFERACLWLPVKIECLFRSLHLLLFLRRSGQGVDWVFGVHLFPFRAHCWLMVGDEVIGDAVHRTTAFTPIMTTGPST